MTNYSIKAIRWLKYISQKENANCNTESPTSNTQATKMSKHADLTAKSIKLTDIVKKSALSINFMAVTSTDANTSTTKCQSTKSHTAT
jgi:hypothetical protein